MSRRVRHARSAPGRRPPVRSLESGRCVALYLARSAAGLLVAGALLVLPALAPAQAPLPPTMNEVKLVASDGVIDRQFGFSVALDGDRALMGAFIDATSGQLSGAAYVFSFNGTDWVQEAKLLASDGAAFDFFGYSVSLSGDRAIVGAFGDDGEMGAAYVFFYDGSTWVEEAKLIASDGQTLDDFGLSVSIDGARAVVGSFGATAGGLTSGAAYAYSFDGVSWSEQAKLSPSDGANDDNFGISVAIDSNRIIVGADAADPVGISSGAAYVYEFNGSAWNEQAKLVAADGTDVDFFGTAVDLSGDRALVGVPQDDDLGIGSGSAYLFEHNGAVWVERTKLLAGDGVTNDHLGAAVAIDGDRLVLGAWGADESGTDGGKAYSFGFDGLNWIELASLVSSDVEAYDGFGVSVSVSGTRAIFGAPGDDLGTGAAYVFSAATTGVHSLLLAERRITLDEQADLTGNIHSNGDIDFGLGRPSVLTGDVTAVSNVVVGPDQTVDGNVTAGGTITLNPLATVTGLATPGVFVPPIPLPTLSFSAGGPNVNVPRRRTVALAPGSYGNVFVRRRSGLVLFNDGTSGDYFFNSLTAEMRAQVFIDTTLGPVTINVVDDVLFDNRSFVWVQPPSGADLVTLNVLNGNVDLNDRVLFQGSIIAPSGTVRVGMGAFVFGAICADEIVLEPFAGVGLPRAAASTSTASAVTTRSRSLAIGAPLVSPVPSSSSAVSTRSRDVGLDRRAP